MQIRPRDLSPEAIELRLMTEADLACADDLRQLAEWNQTLEDWRRLLALEPGGCFIAIHNGVLAGTVTTIAYGKALAWIGMMLVHPEHRRKGIATRLMQRALKYLHSRKVRCAKLDATPAGQPLYEQLGFALEWTLQRWQRSAGLETRRELGTEETRELEEKDWPMVVAIDEAAFGARRAELLRLLLQESRRVRVWPATGKLLGWGLLRPGRNSDYLGPLACAQADGLSVLVSSLLAGSSGRSITWDIPDRNEAAKAAAGSLGFAPVRLLTRMRLGERTDASQPNTLFGIADPAVG